MKNRGGFTFVETLVALAISSTLFVIMIVVFNGRQARVEFSQGLRDIESYIQDVSNDVRTGIYPNLANQKCSIVSGNVTFTNAASISQGTSDSCVYAGSALLINSTGSTQGLLSNYSLAGVKKTPYISISELKPTPMGVTGEETKRDFKMTGGISLVKIGGGGNRIKTSVLLGLIFDVAGVNVDSGTKKVSKVIPFIIPISGVNISNIKSGISSYPFTVPITDAGTKLCFESTNGQTGLIIVKKGPDGLTTESQIGRPIDAATGCVSGV